MPPSGYSEAQVRTIVEFAVSCARVLQIEAETERIPYSHALVREIDHINLLSEDAAYGAAVRAVFGVNKAFYLMLRSLEPSSRNQFEEAIRRTSEKLQSELLEVHRRSEQMKTNI